MSTSESYGGSSGETSTSVAVSGRMRALRIGLGIGTVVLGFVTLFWPSITLLVVAIVFGIQLIAVGGLRIASAVVSKSESGWLRAVLFIVGLLVLLAGLICLRNPALSLLGVAVVISFGWIVNGIVELAAAASPEMPGSRGLRVLTGVVSIVGGLLILFWPGLALLTFTLLGGWLLIIFGVMSTVSALRERHTATRSEPMQAGGSTATA